MKNHLMKNHVMKNQIFDISIENYLLNTFNENHLMKSKDIIN